MEALLASSTPAVEKCMKPQFIRLAPPLHIAEDEVRYQIYSPGEECPGIFVKYLPFFL